MKLILNDPLLTTFFKRTLMKHSAYDELMPVISVMIMLISYVSYVLVSQFVIQF